MSSIATDDVYPPLVCTASKTTENTGTKKVSSPKNVFEERLVIFLWKKYFVQNQDLRESLYGKCHPILKGDSHISTLVAFWWRRNIHNLLLPEVAELETGILGSWIDCSKTGHRVRLPFGAHVNIQHVAARHDVIVEPDLAASRGHQKQSCKYNSKTVLIFCVFNEQRRSRYNDRPGHYVGRKRE